MRPLLEIRDVSVRFGGVKALSGVSCDIAEGEFLSLIGPNGAGKTTLLRVVTGQVKPETARIILAGQDITSLATHSRIRLGLAITHQIVRPFRSMTVLDNVALAVGHERLNRVLPALVSRDRTKERRRALELLKWVGISDMAERDVFGQPLGVLKRLEVARAMALEPKVLFLDEPLAGLNNIEAARLADTIAEINRQGLTVVMIEHNLGEVLRVSRRLVVLDNGVKIGDGDPGEVMHDPAVRAAYVGKEGSDAAA
ncbi:MAG: ABC transporter ATP-binding protein [Deltaproteobacteria bacterium]|nr:ABC transporter ATP-binding protein [Deltaproteobacteria bacterium]